MGSIASEETQVDLTIVGGGPTGLLIGHLAEALGASVCILDSKQGPLKLGRADAMNARTQQVLEIVGILDELIPHGITCNNGDFKSRQSHWWTGLEHCFRKNFLMLGQPVIEQALAKRLAYSNNNNNNNNNNKTATTISYGQTVATISEDDSGVTVTTSQGRAIRSKYAVGADGARSTVRTALGISFTGTKPEMVWAVLDTFIDTDFPVCSEIITFQLNGQSRVSWIPRERNMARFYILLDGEITQEKAEQSIREHMAPHRVNFVKTEWFSTFDVKERIAGTFVSQNGNGRIVLAGDAAHVHSVNGGQGLNTGVADAFALSWRLAEVLTNDKLSPASVTKLIKSYDTERRTVAQGVIDVAAALVRDTVHTAKKYVSTIERNAGYITGMGVSYDGTGSALIHGDTRGIWTPGRRCPDVYLSPCSSSERQEQQQEQEPQQKKRLYELLAGKYGKHLVLKIGRRPPSQGASSSSGAVGSAQGLEKVTRFFTITPPHTPEPSSPESSPSPSSVSSAFSAEWVGIDDDFVVVVRPDMYIGYVGEGEEGWKQYLSYLTQ